MDKWIEFYEPFFENRAETTAFVHSNENMYPENPKHPAQIMMHQTQRLISLADELPKIRPKKDSLQLLFLLICAENIAKLHDKFEKEGKSRTYVHKFFNKFLTDQEKNQLQRGFSNIDQSPYELKEIINLLYDVRCDVVHEGKYWDFHFHDGDVPILNNDPDVIVNIKFDELRKIVVKGCIKAVITYS